MNSRFGSVSSRTHDIMVRQVGVAESERVTRRSVDGDAEEVADATHVAAGGVDLLEDAIFAQRLGTEAGVVPGELGTDANEAGCAAAQCWTNRVRCCRARSGYDNPATH